MHEVALLGRTEKLDDRGFFLLLWCSISMMEQQRKHSSNGNDVTGVVSESLPNTMFKVTLENGEEILAYLAGKMRLHRIRVLVGDRVLMRLDEYGGKARITKRM